MRMQDKYPYYDSVPLGLNGIYSTAGRDSFYVKSSCIKAPSHTITTGHTYLLQCPDGKVLEVRLEDAYHDNINFNLFLFDIKNKRRIKVRTIVDGAKHECSWKLISLDYMQEKVDDLIANAYCENW